MDTTSNHGRGDKNLWSYSVRLLKATFRHWLEDKAPQLGAALAYYTVFSLAPMVLVLLAVFGFIYGNSEVARREILHQLYSFLDRSSARAVEDIAESAREPTASAVATVIGIAAALFGASGVFGQLQDALNTIWGVKPKPGRSLASFLRARFLSFAMVAGVCFLLLVSLTASAVITAVGGYLERLLPGGSVLAWTIHLVLDIGIVTLLFAMVFKFLPDALLSRFSDPEGGTSCVQSRGAKAVNFLQRLFSSDGFMPHGHCYLWNQSMMWLNVISDGLIALAYLTIPVTLIYIARKRKDLPFDWMFACFGVFILACGATHALEIWTLWIPTYWLLGTTKAVTAAASPGLCRRHTCFL